MIGVAIFLALASTAFVAAPSALASQTRTFPSATVSPFVSEYTITFTESGLTAGTNWSVTMDRTSENSTGATIAFLEPNGAYAFFVGAVTGYSAPPEGNVTVSGAPVTVPIVFVSNATTGPSCPSFYWSGDNNTLRGNCLGSFQDDYRSFNATAGWTTANSTFAVGPVAEVSPSGTVVALGVPGFEGSGSVVTVSTAHEVNVTDTIVGNVTNAIGINSSSGAPNGQTPIWSPIEALGGGGSTTWGDGSQVLGGITLGITFHFENGTGAPTNRVKVDVTVSGWPWVSSADALGIEVQAGAFTLPTGSHFVYTASTDTIAQVSNVNATPVWSLSFGPTANATGRGAAPLSVTDQVGLIPPGSSTPTVAVALLTFAGPGGYSTLVYDPWVVFGAPTSQTIVPSPVVPSNGASLPLVAVGAIALVVAVLGVTTYRLRRHPIDEGLTPAA